jgi:signal transduction histidine kinase
LRIDQLLNDVLDLSRAVQIDGNPQPVGKIFQDAARKVSPSGTAVKIEFELSQDLPAIAVDRAALSKAFQAILTNCTESRGQELEISVSIGRRDQTIAITVRDNGEGISRENLTRVRDPFFSTRPKKAGLGLTIADRIIRLHSGYLEIESERGTGTIITMYLPIQQ